MEGPNIFARRVINFIGTRHLRSSVDRVIDICHGHIQGYFTIPGFKWGYFAHTDIGGVISGFFYIGCSKSVLQEGKITIPSFK